MSKETALVKEHEDLLKKIVGGFRVPKADREDLLQEARIAMLRAVEAWDATAGASLKTWITVSVRNRLISVTAKRPLLDATSYAYELGLSSPDDPETAYTRQERIDNVRKACASLPRSRRENVLAILDGRELGSQSTGAEMVRRALPALRASLREKAS